MTAAVPLFIGAEQPLSLFIDDTEAGHRGQRRSFAPEIGRIDAKRGRDLTEPQGIAASAAPAIGGKELDRLRRL
jgi:hypothetical protein